MKTIQTLILLALLQTGALMAETATFAGGCFWCMVAPFQNIEGVSSVISGFTGGHATNPTYEDVVSGKTGHVEAIQITYDAKKATYETLIDTYWKQIDPTDTEGQFADQGNHYKTAIFYHSDTQKQIAETSKEKINQSGLFKAPIATQIKAATPFYPAENYHQDYYKKNPFHYERYKKGSGRADYIENHPLKAIPAQQTPTTSLKQCLTPIQYHVTQEDGTERPFNNEYWDNKEPGIYVDIVSGKPLFASIHKFDSGTGWPSFTQPLIHKNIIEHQDTTLGMPRTEVRSSQANSHLGHVFPDGPGPTGLRYCINSAALRFIPVNELETEGYPDYLSLFQ